MATVKMMQGDSYIVPIVINQMGTPLTPDMVADIEVCVGDALRKTFSGGGVGYDTATKYWYIRPSQAETLAMEAAGYKVIARVKFKNGESSDVIGLEIGQILITDTHSPEVI